MKVYVNGTLSSSDPAGRVFYDYGDSSTSTDLLMGTEGDAARRAINGAFDEFIIWERALSPREVQLYFTAAIGECSETLGSPRDCLRNTHSAGLGLFYSGTSLSVFYTGRGP